MGKKRKGVPSAWSNNRELPPIVGGKYLGQFLRRSEAREIANYMIRRLGQSKWNARVRYANTTNTMYVNFSRHDGKFFKVRVADHPPSMNQHTNTVCSQKTASRFCAFALKKYK